MDDIYIHGPKGETSKQTPQPGPVDNNDYYDISESTPIEDLKNLFKKPSLFFSAFKGGSSELDLGSWIWTKAFITFFFFHWLASFQSSTSAWDNVEHSFDGVLGSSTKDSVLSMLGPDLGPLKDKAAFIMLFFQQAGIFSAPILALVSLLGFVWVSQWGLKLFGVSENKISFKGIFISGLYAKSFIGFSILPFLGSTLAAVLPIFYYLNALKVLSNESYPRVFLASYGLNLLMWSIFVLAIFLMVLIFVGSLGSMIST